MRATRKVPPNFKVLNLSPKSLSFRLCCDCLSVLQPHSPGGAGSAWNLITKQSPAPQGAAGSPRARLTVLFMVSDFIYLPASKLLFCIQRTLAVACCLRGRGCRELGRDGWRSEPIVLAEEPVPFLRVTYVMQRGPAHTPASPHQLSPRKVWDGWGRPGLDYTGLESSVLTRRTRLCPFSPLPQDQLTRVYSNTRLSHSPHLSLPRTNLEDTALGKVNACVRDHKSGVGRRLLFAPDLYLSYFLPHLISTPFCPLASSLPYQGPAKSMVYQSGSKWEKRNQFEYTMEGMYCRAWLHDVGGAKSQMER